MDTLENLWKLSLVVLRYGRQLRAWPAERWRHRGGSVVSAVRPDFIDRDAGLQHEVQG
jgi:hypothetical protein